MSAEELEAEHVKKIRETESKKRFADLERASKDFEDAWTTFCVEQFGFQTLEMAIDCGNTCHRGRQ